VQQISQATKKLHTFIEKVDTSLSNEESVVTEGFASTLRHDMRTPINAIRGYSEIIAEEMQEATEPQKFLTSIINATDIILENIAKITPIAWKN
jgi:signal transduction histidine kinase